MVTNLELELLKKSFAVKKAEEEGDPMAGMLSLVKSIKEEDSDDDSIPIADDRVT